MDPARDLLAMLAQVLFKPEADGFYYIDETPHTLEQLVDKLTDNQSTNL